tara:strand:+ start:5933 stop:6442 length:510 start_codon:yes stop_codon:yes gene_type:complete
MVHSDDFDVENSNKQTFIVKDERAALRIKREETKEAQARYKAVVAKQKAEIEAERAMRREEIQLELARIKLNQSSSEKARNNIAILAPLLLMVLVGGFIAALATGAIPDESVSVASALLTLLATGLLQNLRSIVAETNGHEENGNGNGHDTKAKSPAKKPESPQPKDKK